MALLQVSVPSPTGTLATTGALIPINQEDILLAHRYAQSDFLRPYIDATVSAVLKDDLEIRITRDLSVSAKKATKPPPPPRNPDREEPVSNDEVSKKEKRGKGPPETRPPGMPAFPEFDSKLPTHEEIELPPEEVKHIREKLGPRCRDILTEALITGIVPVTVYAEPGKKGLVSFAVQDYRNRLLFMRRNSIRPVPEWFVEYLDRKAGKIRIDGDGNIERSDLMSSTAKTGLSGPGSVMGTADKPVLSYDPTVTVQDNENNVGLETMEGNKTHLIYVMYPPTPDGHLTSPVMRSIRPCAALTFLRYTEQYTAKNRSIPLHVIGTGTGGRGGPGGGTTGRETLTEGRFANGDVVVGAEEAAFKLYAQDIHAYAVAKQMANASNVSVPGDAARRAITPLQTAGGMYTYIPPNPNAATTEDIAMATPPYQANSLVLPGGQQMFPGPQSESLKTLPEFIEWMERSLAATWEIPPQVLDPQGSKYASNEKLVTQKWEEKIQWYLAHLSQYVSEIYSAAHYKDGRRFAKILAQSLEKEGMDSDTGAAPSKETTFETPELAEADKLLTERKKGKMRDRIRSSIRVEATFHHNYTVDTAIAVQLHNMNGIDDNTLIGVLGSAAGIPRNRLLLTQAERDVQRAKRNNEQHESMLATLPPPGAPPAKKPSAGPPDSKGQTKD